MPTIAMNTTSLNKFLDRIGKAVYCMNTITVSLSIMPEDDVRIPEGLDISWKSTNIEHGKTLSKNFVRRSCYVYVAESVFEYLDSISKNPFWVYEQITFMPKSENDSKATRVYTFLKSIPGITPEMAILSELLCHWRNKVIHGESSKAVLSSKKIDILRDKKDWIYDNLHHFDVDVAINNYNTQKVTLKDVSTLATIAIKCCRLVDEYYFQGINTTAVSDDFFKKLNECPSFRQVNNQTKSEKKDRQIRRWLLLNYPYLDEAKKMDLISLMCK